MLYTLPDGSQEYWSEEGLHRQDGPAVIRSNGTEEWWLRGVRHRQGGPAYLRPDGSFSYWREGQLHRQDGPALRRNGLEAYYLFGELHRTDGPALRLADGTEIYFQEGKLHREDGPAIIRANDSFDNWHQGQKEWWLHGVRHRQGGPAIEHLSGYQAYYQNGKLHRTDGPARIFPDGSSEYYLEGELQQDERGERARELSESDVVAFYETGTEDDRLHGNGFPTMEFARARRAILKILPREKQEILDIGGGPGLYSGWLAALGHSVTLLDPVPEHVYRARALASQGPHFEALLGDALQLPLEDESFSFIVMFGPMYHLQEDGQRDQALREAFRVLRPGGSIILSALNRHVPLIQGAATDLLELPSYRRAIAGSNPILQGSHHPITPRGEWFEVAYGHGTKDLREEVEAAGFAVSWVTGKEGPAWMLDVHDQTDHHADQLENLLWAAEEADAFEEFAAVSSHLLLLAEKPAP